MSDDALVLVDENKRQEMEAYIFEKLDRRRAEKSSQYAQKLVEREEQNRDSQNAINQLDTWLSSLSLSLDTRLVEHDPASVDTVANTTFLDETALDIQKLEAFFAEKSNFILAYDVRRIQMNVVDLKTKYQEVQDLIQPKKKFGFRGNKKKQEGHTSNTPFKQDTAVPHHFSHQGFQVDDRKGETIEVTRSDIKDGGDVLLTRLSECTIKILCGANTIHIADLVNCTFLCGPVKTSVFIDRCKDCKFVISCQQLRTHQTTKSDFYLHVTSKGIIEDCEDVRFAPYTFSYPDLEEDYETAGLSKSINNWDKIDDFNWLSSDQPSPHWSIIPDDQRLTLWL